MEKYYEDVLAEFMYMRRTFFKVPSEGTLPTKYKELIIPAVQLGLGRESVFHARKAIDAGPTAKEVAEVLSLVILLAGMTT